MGPLGGDPLAPSIVLLEEFFYAADRSGCFVKFDPIQAWLERKRSFQGSNATSGLEHSRQRCDRLWNLCIRLCSDLREIPTALQRNANLYGPQTDFWLNDVLFFFVWQGNYGRQGVFFFVLGNNKIGVWPLKTQTV
jgi:hypothetical protein